MTLGRIFLGFLAILISFLYLYGVWRAPNDDQVYKRVTGIDDFTLEYDPTNAPDSHQPVMGIGYARWANFSRIVYEGNSYDQVGIAASFITKNAKPTRYLVHEGYRLKSGPFGVIRYGTLEIKDQQTRQMIAMKEWRCDQTRCNYAPEGVQGWPGQFAVKFVRDVLNPSKPVSGAIGVTPYPPTVGRIENLTQTTPVDPNMLKSKTSGCPDDVAIEHRINKDMHHSIVTRSDWTFIPQQNARQVICNSKGLFVFSSYSPNEIFIDWLDIRGKLLGQYYKKTDFKYSYQNREIPFLSDLQVNSDVLEFKISYVPEFLDPKEQGDVIPKWEGMAKISLINSGN